VPIDVFSSWSAIEVLPKYTIKPEFQSTTMILGSRFSIKKAKWTPEERKDGKILRNARKEGPRRQPRHPQLQIDSSKSQRLPC
jgi:hypothetical protein